MINDEHSLTINDCHSEVSATVRRILNQIKHTSDSFASTHKLQIENLNAFLAGAASNPQPILDALYCHPGVDIQTLLNTNSLKKFKKKISQVPPVITMTELESRKTSRIFQRGPNQEQKVPFYRYFDTATSPLSPLRPELIEQLTCADGSSPIEKSYFNRGHFEDQMTLYLGDLNLHWTDKFSQQHIFIANKFSSSYKLPFVPHSFTARTNIPSRILAVTYIGPIANSEFTALAKKLTLDELCSVLDEYNPANSREVLDGESVVTNKPLQVSEKISDTSTSVRLLNGIPGQPNSAISLLIVSLCEPLVLSPSPNYQWIFNCSETSVEVTWASNKFHLTPDSSMSVAPNIELKFQNQNLRSAIIACFSARAGDGDPFMHAKKILEHVGPEAISRIQHETNQWFD